LVNFYCSVEHVESWLPRAPRAGRQLSLEEAAQAGARLWARMRDAGQ
jgi:hypothetical protein